MERRVTRSITGPQIQIQAKRQDKDKKKNEENWNIYVCDISNSESDIESNAKSTQGGTTRKLRRSFAAASRRSVLPALGDSCRFRTPWRSRGSHKGAEMGGWTHGHGTEARKTRFGRVDLRTRKNRWDFSFAFLNQ